jgi:hypothetical protein
MAQLCAVYLVFLLMLTGVLLVVDVARFEAHKGDNAPSSPAIPSAIPPPSTPPSSPPPVNQTSDVPPLSPANHPLPPLHPPPDHPPPANPPNDVT